MPPFATAGSTASGWGMTRCPSSRSIRPGGPAASGPSATPSMSPGWKKPAEVTDYMNAADFLCLPSQNEGVANVVLESFACGIPVVATAVGGIPEVVVAGETGLLATPFGDTAALAALVQTLLRNPARRTALGEAARRRARELFSAQVIVTRYEELYGRIRS